MAITTYGDLRSSVQSWLNRTDAATIEAIPTFIAFAEKDFQRTLKLPQYEMPINGVASSTTGTAATNKFDSSADTNGVTLEDNYYEMKHFMVNGFPYDRVDVDTFNKVRLIGLANMESNQDPTQPSDSKKYSNVFCRVGNKILTYPELKDGDAVSYIYWEEYPTMTSDSDLSASLDIAPDVMLYLCLRHAAVFLRDNDQAQFWTQKAEEAGTKLYQQLDEIEWSGSPLTVRQMGK